MPALYSCARASVVDGVVGEVAGVVVAVVAVQRVNGGAVFCLEPSVKCGRQHVGDAAYRELEVKDTDVLLQPRDGRGFGHERHATLHSGGEATTVHKSPIDESRHLDCPSQDDLNEQTALEL